MEHAVLFQSLVLPEKFQHILRVLNTNIDGRIKIMFAITAIKVCNSSTMRILATSFYLSGLKQKK